MRIVPASDHDFILQLKRRGKGSTSVVLILVYLCPCLPIFDYILKFEDIDIGNLE
jgi:hypothetical protein